MNRYIINLGFINITWYAFFIVMAMIIGVIILFNNKKVLKHFTKDELYNYVFYLAIFSILGARLWYVLFSDYNYFQNPLSIIAIWQGGLAIHGGILGGFFYTIYYSKKNSENFFILTDALIAPLLLGQSIGRWGNFVNQEAHGPQTTKSFLENTLHLPQFIVEGMNINGTYYIPTFLFESIWNLVGFILVFFILQKIWQNKLGFITAFYCVWYGTIRTIIEHYRTDALHLFNTNIKVAQLISVFMIFFGLFLFIYLAKKEKMN